MIHLMWSLSLLTITFALVSCGNPLTSEDASIVSINPSSGSQLTGAVGSPLVGPIKITFDASPTDVSLTNTQGIATWHLSGRELTITDAACSYNSSSDTGGLVELHLKWTTGAHYISYECRRPRRPSPPPAPPEPPPPATTVYANPPHGSTIPSNTIISIELNHPVTAVLNATGSGRSWKIPASENLRIEWINKDGSHGGPVHFNYRLRAPDTSPPRLLAGSVANGAKKVDPGPLNADRIKFRFDEPVTGSIELIEGNNRRLGWQAIVKGKTAELIPIAGHELRFALTYLIIITVEDALGNKAEYRIEFTTRPIE